METALPLVFMGLMGFALLLYVILDGYDFKLLSNTLELGATGAA